MKDKNLAKVKDNFSNAELKPPIVQRIEEFVNFKKKNGKFSVLKFQEAIDVSGSYVKNIRKSISDEVVLKIEEQFPELNVDWLKFGRGDMLKSMDQPEGIYASEVAVSKESQSKPIPVYDIDAFAGRTSLVNTTESDNIIGWARMPGYEDCIGWVRARGDSMFPVVKSNDMIGIMAAINKKFILWGSMYVVAFAGDMPPHPMLKYIRKGPDKSTIILRSHNTKYEDMEVALDDIQAIYPARAGVVEF